MNVLLIRSDLPRSPEVLLLSGLLSESKVDWVPSPATIFCKLVELWAWVAEHGARDSDSLDYLVPSRVVGPLEAQLGCCGLVAAMCTAQVNWCESRGDLVAFCRFAEWNGPEALKRRGDSARAKRTRERSKARILRTENLPPARETPPKTSAKAHAKRNARHVSRANDIDVDVDVYKNSYSKTSTSTSEPPEPAPPDPNPPAEPVDPLELFARIRAAFRSTHNADARQVAADRELAWKVAIVVAEQLGPAWLEKVFTTAAKTSMRKPYAYLWNAVEKGLRESGRDEAKRVLASITAPLDLEQIDTAPPRMEPPRRRPVDTETIRQTELRRFRAELIGRGIHGDELVAAVDTFESELTQRLRNATNEPRFAAATN